MNREPTRATLVHPTIAQSVQVWLLRMVAVYCLLYGVFYWIRLIGINDGAGWRFDLMPVYWQVAAVTLAMFFPFAAIGLWMLASWGPVIWAICAAAEITMYAGFPHLFGRQWETLVVHVLVALVYAAVTLVIYLQRKQPA